MTIARSTQVLSATSFHSGSAMSEARLREAKFVFEQIGDLVCSFRLLYYIFLLFSDPFN
jgi:hypothetical protein